jgi:hypothetical protein
MLNIIEQAWGWTGLEPAEVVEQNAFGNVVVRAIDGRFWRICPEVLACTVIAADLVEFTRLRETDEFTYDWEMTELVRMATRRLGPVTSERCYCLKVPALFEGTYTEGNLGTVARAELIAFSGDIAEQIKEIPDGGRATVTVKWPAPN